MATARKQKWTVEAYLDFERASELRHEYHNGNVVEMLPSHANHSLIAGSAMSTLYSQLREQTAYVFGISMRVKVSRTFYAYPDIAVVLGKPQLEDEYKDSLLNPTLIVEVLSPSTERYDRGEKFQQYRTLASLQEYVLISQDSPCIERYLRQPDNQWLLTDAAGLDAALELPSIGCTLRLAEVYARVIFEDDPS